MFALHKGTIVSVSSSLDSVPPFIFEDHTDMDGGSLHAFALDLPQVS
jgi:hypothetical protein